MMKAAAKHDGGKAVRKHFDHWKAYVRTRKTERQHDEDMEELAVSHFKRMILVRYEMLKSNVFFSKKK